MYLMSIEELAEYLGESKRTVYRYLQSGDCPRYIRLTARNKRGRRLSSSRGRRRGCSGLFAEFRRDPLANCIASTGLRAAACGKITRSASASR